MGLQDGGTRAVEIKSVVLEERASALKALAHIPYGTVESGSLPVTLRAETIPFSHETLGRKARNLVKTAARLLHIHISEVIEVGGEALGSGVLEDSPKRKLSLGGIPHLPVGDARLVLNGRVVLIKPEVFSYKRIHVGIRHSVEIRHHRAERHIVHMIPEPHLGLHLVSVSHGHIVHLVAEADDAAVLGIGPCRGHSLPYGDMS